MSKLTQKQRVKIVDKAIKGYSHVHLAEKYGVSRPTISNIVREHTSPVLSTVQNAELLRQRYIKGALTPKVKEAVEHLVHNLAEVVRKPKKGDRK